MVQHIQELSQKIGFKMNRYDPYVANMDIHRKQRIICWYVDDMKISHMEHRVVDYIINKIEDNFGKITVTRGKIHKLVGIDIEFTDDKTVKIKMIDYIAVYFDAFGEPIVKEANTPAKHNLFEV